MATDQINLINAIKDELKFVIKKQCNAEIVPGPLKQHNPKEIWSSGPKKHIIAISNIQINNQDYSVAFCFMEIDFINYANHFFQADYSIDNINEEVRDIVSEFLNMTLGRVKRYFLEKFESEVYNSIPQTLLSHHLEVVSSLKYPLVSYILESKLGPFHLLLMSGYEKLISWEQRI